MLNMNSWLSMGSRLRGNDVLMLTMQAYES
jgi:hypothetical protein